MVKLMGHNMMRKDGDAHMAERSIFFLGGVAQGGARALARSVQAHADRILDGVEAKGRADLLEEFALPLSGECLKSVTGLTNIHLSGDGCLVAGHDRRDCELRRRQGHRGALPCGDRRHRRGNHRHAPRRAQNAEPLAARRDDQRRHAGGERAPQYQADHLGRQNEPRKAIAGCIWALLTHPDQFARVREGAVSWLAVFEEFARWISPIGMSPRRIAKAATVNGVDFAVDDRVFLMFGSANRDEGHFANAHQFDLTRDTAKSIAFGAGPHFCAGAAASRAMIADVALPSIFGRLKRLRLDDREPVRIGGWAFRGLQNLPVRWEA
jgi:cytochrome P450